RQGYRSCGILAWMQAPLFVRPLTAHERAALEAGLRSAGGFPVRRCPLLLASAEGQQTTARARTLRCNDQTVRTTIHDFHLRGRAALQPHPPGPPPTQATVEADGLDRLRELFHQRPRVGGQATRVWPLALAAEGSFAQGRTRWRVRAAPIRAALA